MKNYMYTFFFLMCFNSLLAQDLKRTGTAFSGIQMAMDERGINYFINQHDVIIAHVDSIKIDPNNVLSKINGMSMEERDKELILRMLKLYPDNAQKLTELKNIAKTYTSIDRLLMEEYYTALKSHIGQQEFEKILNEKE